MGSLSNFSEDELLDHVFNQNTYTPAATLYLALATADPTDAGTGASMNEVADSNNYSRKAITFGAAASRRVTQNADVDYDQASGSWGTVTHWAIVDSATHGAGNMLAHGAFGTSKAVVSGNTPSVVSAEVYVEISAGVCSDYLANLMLDFMFRNQSLTPPDTYAALCTATVADDDTGSTITEPGGGSYAREIIQENGGASPAWSAVSGGALSNGAAVTFTQATASWGTIVALAIVDAAAAGNLLTYDNANVTDQAVGEDDTAEFATGDIDVSLS